MNGQREGVVKNRVIPIRKGRVILNIRSNEICPPNKGLPRAGFEPAAHE